MQDSPNSRPTEGLEIFSDRNFPEWLAQEQISIGYTTYQTDRLTLLGVNSETGRFSGFERSFGRAMGLYVRGNSLYLGTKYQIWQFENALELGQLHDGYDKLYIPKVGYTTGDLDVHDIVVDGNGQLVFVSTMLNCLATLSPSHSCKPIWKPPFISRVINEDRCHLNGLALVDGFPRYVTVCSQSDIVDGWRDRRVAGGCAIDIQTNEILVRGLSMPHSPRFYQGKLWLLNSGTGELGTVDMAAGRFEPLVFCPGFLRGLAFWKNWAIVGLSKPRHGDRSFSGLPLDETLTKKDADPRCGLMVIDLASGAIVHWYQIEGIVTELYDVQVLPNVQRPMLLGFQTEEIAQLISIAPADLAPISSNLIQPLTPPAPTQIEAGIVTQTETQTDIFQPLQIDPTRSEQIALLRQQRDRLAQNWLQLPAVQLPSTYAGELGQLQQTILNSDLKYLPLDRSEQQRLEQAIAQLETDPRSQSALLILMLYAFPHDLTLGWYKPVAVPAWLANDYLRFMLNNPTIFREVGEVDQYYEYMQDWVGFLHHKILANPNSESWQQVALLFTQVNCFIPFYFSDRNLKQIYIQRADIIEVALKSQGCQLDWQFPDRSTGKIRLGILRREFSPSPETYATLPIFEFLDRDRFEITLYAFQESGDRLEKYCQNRVDRFVLLPPETIDAVDQIRQDHLDVILISQNLTATCNLVVAVASHRLARISIASDVSPLTSGIARIDYLLCGELAQTTPNAQAQYTEKLLLHDGGANCFSFYCSPEQDSEYPNIKVDRQLWGADRDSIVLISGANYFKIIPELQETWAKILASIPNSILVLYPFNPNWIDRYPEDLLIEGMQKVLQKHGIAINRLIVLSHKLSRLDIQTCLKSADIYLDSFPYSGSTSFIDPLQVGMPVVTKRGNCFRTNMSSSFLQLLSLPELILTTEAEYINLAVKLANDPKLRQSYRAQISEKMAQTPKFLDSVHHASQVGKILRDLHSQNIEDKSLIDLAQSHLDRSRFFKQQNQLSEAETCLREAVRIYPQFWGAWNNLGTLLQNQNRLEEASQCYEIAILHNPNFAESISNRASLWQLDGELERAKTDYLQAIQLKPDHVPAHFNLATIYKQQGRLEASIEHFQEVVKLQPNYHEAHFALAQILEYRDRYELAEQHYQLAEQFSPNPLQISLVVANLQLRFCDWREYEKRTQDLIAILSDPIQRQQCYLSPLAASNFPIPLELHRAMAEVRGRPLVQQATQLQLKHPSLRFSHDRSARPKLRLGYISPDFREHAVGRLICELFQHHDRARFEIFAYSCVDVNDRITQQVRSGCDRYVDLSALSTADAAKQIHADGIDIMIDLAGYTIGNLAEVLALQPAPIQIQWLGYPDTMGAPFIQYILADSWLIPPEHTSHFTEEVIHLPHAFVSSPLPIRDRPFTRTELGLPKTGFIYCCFNSHYKINPAVFDVWMRILTQVPKSVLWLTDGDERAKQNLRQAAIDRNVDPKRLIFASKKDHGDYLAQFQVANLFLDTFIYNAGSTAAAAIWAGLPLLTKLGETYAGRMGASICSSVGLESMICESVEEYEQRSIEFGKNPALLKSIKSKLQKHKEKLPLFDLPQFARDLESAYRRIWDSDGN